MKPRHMLVIFVAGVSLGVVAVLACRPPRAARQAPAAALAAARPVYWTAAQWRAYLDNETYRPRGGELVYRLSFLLDDLPTAVTHYLAWETAHGIPIEGRIGALDRDLQMHDSLLAALADQLAPDPVPTDPFAAALSFVELAECRENATAQLLHRERRNMTREDRVREYQASQRAGERERIRRQHLAGPGGY
jgi:hypothetical protein